MTEEKIRIIEVEERTETTKDNMPKPKFKEIFDPQQTVCDDFHEWVRKETEKVADPIMVHMTILGQTLKIMKSVMPSADYDGIMETVYQSKDRIEPFKKTSIH